MEHCKKNHWANCNAWLSWWQLSSSNFELCAAARSSPRADHCGHVHAAATGKKLQTTVQTKWTQATNWLLGQPFSKISTSLELLTRHILRGVEHVHLQCCSASGSAHSHCLKSSWNWTKLNDKICPKQAFEESCFVFFFTVFAFLLSAYNMSRRKSKKKNREDLVLGCPATSMLTPKQTRCQKELVWHCLDEAIPQDPTSCLDACSFFFILAYPQSRLIFPRQHFFFRNPWSGLNAQDLSSFLFGIGPGHSKPWLEFKKHCSQSFLLSLEQVSDGCKHRGMERKLEPSEGKRQDTRCKLYPREQSGLWSWCLPTVTLWHLQNVNSTLAFKKSGRVTRQEDQTCWPNLKWFWSCMSGNLQKP